MNISPSGLAKIKAREGFRLKAYRDSKGIPTIGVGHTGPEVRMTMRWTEQQVDQQLAKDLVEFEAAVNSAIKRPMTQSQFDACVSLAFNIGTAGFVGSSVVRQINAGNERAAADDFLMWERPVELAARRQDERAQFLS